MNISARVLNIALRACGFGALALGLAFWSGHAWSLRRLHTALGIGVVLCLWALTGIAWTRTPRNGLAMFAVVWGLGAWMLGVTQTQILPGTFHWVVEVTHLVAGVVAMGLGARLRASATSPSI